MSSCPVCGLDEPGGKFCRRCGASLAAGSGDTSSDRSAYESENADRRRRRILVATGTGLVTLTLGLAVWWFIPGVAAGPDGEPKVTLLHTELDPSPNSVPAGSDPLAPDIERLANDPGIRIEPGRERRDDPPIVRPSKVAPSEPATSRSAPRTEVPPRRTLPERVNAEPSATPPASPVVISEPPERRDAREPVASPPAVPEPAPLVLPLGLRFAVRLHGALSSKTAQVEDRFEAASVSDVALEGGAVIPAGSTLRGVVTGVAPGTRTNRTARLSVEFDLITIAGRSYPIRGTTDEIVGRGLKGETKRMAVGAGLGAVLGGLLGGAKGAATGAAIGGGGTIAATEGKDVELVDGAVLNVVLAP